MRMFYFQRSKWEYSTVSEPSPSNKSLESCAGALSTVISDPACELNRANSKYLEDDKYIVPFEMRWMLAKD